jgi:thymidine phosphorylase
VTESSSLPAADVEVAVDAPRGGVVAGWNARALGEILVRLGGGRARKEDAIDPGVGIRLLRRDGATVRAGDPVALVRARRETDVPREAVARAIDIVDAAPPAAPLLLEEIGS